MYRVVDGGDVYDCLVTQCKLHSKQQQRCTQVSNVNSQARSLKSLEAIWSSFMHLSNEPGELSQRLAMKTEHTTCRRSDYRAYPGRHPWTHGLTGKAQQVTGKEYTPVSQQLYPDYRLQQMYYLRRTHRLRLHDPSQYRAIDSGYVSVA